MFDPVAMGIDKAIQTMLTREPEARPELAPLFAQLHSAESQERADAERSIWTFWCSHEDQMAARAMGRVIEAFEAGEMADAQRQLDDMVKSWPDWAEAWNRRATLHFTEGRDSDSLNDIIKTLELEPRHFGALAGLGQICLRAGDTASALLVFEQAVLINPNMRSIRRAVDVLTRQNPPTLH